MAHIINEKTGFVSPRKTAWHGIPPDDKTVLQLPVEVAEVIACNNCKFYHRGRYDYTFRVVDSMENAKVTYRVAGSKEFHTYVFNWFYGLWYKV